MVIFTIVCTLTRLTKFRPHTVSLNVGVDVAVEPFRFRVRN